MARKRKSSPRVCRQRLFARKNRGVELFPATGVDHSLPGEMTMLVTLLIVILIIALLERGSLVGVVLIGLVALALMGRI